MKKRYSILLLAACTLTTLAACGGKSMITTGNEKLADAVYNNDYVSLANYTGLEAEKKDYLVTDEAVENQIHERLLEYADYHSVNRASKKGDWVYTNFKASVDGSVVTQDDDYYFIIGAAEFGDEFDKKLTGVSTGDELSFSLDYDSDFTDVEWAGQKVDFEINVTDVQEEILPNATDEFIKENTEYASYDEFVKATRDLVTDNYEAESTNELQEELLQQVVDTSSILQYTKDEYEKARATIENGYLGYVDMFGLEDLDALYESFEMTEEDVEEEIQAQLYRSLVVNAIIENEDFTLSDQDYEDGVAYYMEQNDYDSKNDFLNDFGEDEVRDQLLEDMVLNFLVNHANITEVQAEYEAD